MTKIESIHTGEIIEHQTIPSVQVAFIRQSDYGKEVFLVHKITESFRGQWCFPGGKLDPGETSKQAACREPLEETGVIIQETDLQYLRTTTSQTQRQISGKQVLCKYIIDVFTVSAVNLSPFNASPDEHDKAGWFTFDDALEMHSSAVKNVIKNGGNTDMADKIPDALAPRTLETIKILSVAKDN